MNLKAIVGVIVVVVAAAVVGAVIYLQPVVELERNYHSIMPDEYLLQVEVTSLRRLPAAVRDLRLVEAFRESAFYDPFVEEIWPEIREEAVTEKFDEARSVYEGFAEKLSGFGGGYIEGSGFSPEELEEIVFAFELSPDFASDGERAGELEQFFEEKVLDLIKELPPVKEFEELEHREALIYRFTSADEDLEISFVGDVLILTLGDEAAERVIDRYLEQPSAGRSIVSRGRGEKPGFHLEFSSKMYQAFDWVEQFDDEEIPAPDFGLHGWLEDMYEMVDSSVAHLMIDEGLFRVVTEARYRPEIEDPYWEAILSVEAGEIESVKFFPEETLAYYGARLPDGEQLFAGLTQMMDETVFDQENDDHAEMARTMFEQTLSGPFADLGEEIAVGISLKPETIVEFEENPAGLLRAVLITLQTETPETYTNLLEQFQMLPGVEVSEDELKVTEGLEEPLSIYYDYVEGFLIFAGSRDEMEAAAARFDSNEGLVTTEHYKDLAARTTDNLTGKIYLTLTPFAGPIRDGLIEELAPGALEDVSEELAERGYEIEPAPEIAAMLEKIPGLYAAGWFEEGELVKGHSELYSGLLAEMGLFSIFSYAAVQDDFGEAVLGAGEAVCDAQVSSAKGDIAVIQTAAVQCRMADDCDLEAGMGEQLSNYLPERIWSADQEPVFEIDTRDGELTAVYVDDVGCPHGPAGERGMMYDVETGEFEPWADGIN